MSDLWPAITFATGLYRERASTAWSGLVRRDPMALLQLGPGRADPYSIYNRLREGGTLTPTRMGNYNWVTTSHRVCDSVLRDRRFGVRAEDESADEGLQASFLLLNPPDHTRLRKLATPGFDSKAVAGYTDRIERTTGDLLDAATASGRCVTRLNCKPAAMR